MSRGHTGPSPIDANWGGGRSSFFCPPILPIREDVLMFLGIRQKKTVPSLSFCSLIAAKGVGREDWCSEWGGYNFQKQLKGPFTRAKKKRSGSDKNSKGSDKFLRVNDTWPIPVLPVQLKKGSIGAFFGTERIKIGSVLTFSFFFFPRCKRSPSFWNRSESFFPEPEILLRQPCLLPHAFCALLRPTSSRQSGG